VNVQEDTAEKVVEHEEEEEAKEETQKR